MNDNPKILIVSLAPDNPGTVFGLIKENQSMGRNIEIAVPIKGKWYNYAIENNIKAHLIPCSTLVKGFFKKRIVNLKTVISLRKVYKKGGYDIVHLHVGQARILGRIASLWMKNKPIMITVIHGQDKNLISYIMEKALSWIDDFRIAVSEDTKKTYISQGVAKREMFVIYNGLDLERFDSIPVDKDYLYNELGLDKNIRLVGMVAYFYGSKKLDVKGHKVFLDSAKIILQKDPLARFILVGSNLYGHGNYMEQIQEYARSLGIDEFVYFLGKRDDIPNILDSLKVLVLPSLVREGFGMVLVEAMARSIPTIGSSIGGIPEVIADGETGLLIPPSNAVALANAVEDILSDPEKAKAMGEAGRKRVEENFTVKIMAERYVRLKNKLVKNRGDI